MSTLVRNPSFENGCVAATRGTGHKKHQGHRERKGSDSEDWPPRGLLLAFSLIATVLSGSLVVIYQH